MAILRGFPSSSASSWKPSDDPEIAIEQAPGAGTCNCEVCQSVPKCTKDRWQVIGKKLLAQFGKRGMTAEEEINDLCSHIYPIVAHKLKDHVPEIHQILSKILIMEEVKISEIPEDEKEDVDPAQAIKDFEMAVDIVKQGQGKCSCMTPEQIRAKLQQYL